MTRKKILLIGGTGTISSSIMRMLARANDVDLFVLNRGNKEIVPNTTQLIVDANDEVALTKALEGHTFDVVVDFIVYLPEQAKQRINVFKGKVKQYIFISTVVTFQHEDTVWLDEESDQENIFSSYGQNKQECERIYMEAYEEGFPVTIVRPSQTYGFDRFPLSVKGKNCWSVVVRILRNKPVIVHGDGKSIWHMMHTYDFAYNFVQLINKKETIGKSINLVNPACVTWDMIYHELGRQLHRDVKIVHIASDTLALSKEYDMRSSILGDKQYSNLYNKHVLEEYIPKFACKIDLQKGTQMFLQYLEENREVRIDDEAFDKWCDHVIREYRKFMESFEEKF